MSYSDIAEKLPFWGDLTADEKREVQSSCLTRKFEKGQTVSGCSVECPGLLMVLSGTLRAYIISPEGREITLFRLHRGDVCVLSASCVISQITFDTITSAEVDSEILIVGTGTVNLLKEENIKVRCFLYEVAVERFSSVMFMMQEVMFKGFDQRLASFIVSEYDRTGSDEIRMTHSEIARQTSSAREVVARMLKRFASDGFVEMHRGYIRIKDIGALRKL